MKCLLFLCCISASITLLAMEEKLIKFPDAAAIKKRLNTLPKDFEDFVENSELHDALGNKTFDQTAVDHILNASIEQYAAISPIRMAEYFLSVSKPTIAKALLTPTAGEPSETERT